MEAIRIIRFDSRGRQISIDIDEDCLMVATFRGLSCPATPYAFEVFDWLDDQGIDRETRKHLKRDIIDKI